MSDKKHKRIKISYIIISMIALAYVILASKYSGLRTEFYDADADVRVIDPDKDEYVSDNIEKFTFYVDDSAKINRCIKFITSHEECEVYCNGEIVFERKNENPTIFGKSPGTAMNTVPIPYGTTEIVINIINPLGNSGHTKTFYYGNGLRMMSDLFKESAIPVIISLFIIFCGLLILIFWIISYKRYELNPGTFYFGIFTTELGFWSLNETDIAIDIISNRMAASIFGYLMLGLMIYPFLQFTRNYLGIEITKLFYCAIGSSFLGVIALAILHILGICDYVKSSWILQLLLVIAMIYVIYATFKQYNLGVSKAKITANIIATLALLFSTTANIIRYYLGGTQSKISGKIGILIFILSLGIQTTIDTFKQVNEGKKAEFYKNLAYNDLMTGLLNRSAFEKWESETLNFKGYAIVTFDLNDLKKTNDTLGHATGDLYITRAASIIKMVFEEIGKCYRIGGDEFCCILEHKNFDSIEDYIARLRKVEETTNAQFEKLSIQMAIGYAEYEDGDNNFEEIRHRADKKMYENKFEMKHIPKYNL